MPPAGAGFEFFSKRAHDDIDHGDGFGPAGMSDPRLGRGTALGSDGLGADGLRASLSKRRPCWYRPRLIGVLCCLVARDRDRSRLISQFAVAMVNRSNTSGRQAVMTRPVGAKTR